MPATKPPRLRPFSPAWTGRLFFRLSKKEYIAGIEVGISTGKAEKKQIIRAKLTEALALLERYDQRRFAYLKRDVPRILALGQPHYRGIWFQSIALCELNDNWMLKSETTPVEIAGVLAHEAMHARLHRWGFGYEEKDRVKIERVCFNASRAFALRLPDTMNAGRSAILRDTERQLVRSPAFWTDENRMEVELASLREMGCSPWMYWLASWLVKRRIRRAKSAGKTCY